MCKPLFLKHFLQFSKRQEGTVTIANLQMQTLRLRKMKQFVHVTYEGYVAKGSESSQTVFSPKATSLFWNYFLLLTSGCHENPTRESITTSLTAPSGCNMTL